MLQGGTAKSVPELRRPEKRQLLNSHLRFYS